jgi:uncharacterized protein (TIGR03435 family)
MTKHILLLSTGIAALACLAMSGQDGTPSTQAAKPTFEVASIKPAKPPEAGRMMVGIRVEQGRFVANNMSVRMLIQQAYNLKDFQVTGAPGWVNSERYDIVAKPEGPVTSDLRGETLRLMLQSLLEDRFKLKSHFETKELPVYNLVVGKGGPKLKESEAGQEDRQMQRMGRGQASLNGANMAMLVRLISQALGRDVIDKTGLTGRYDIELKWTPDEAAMRGPGEGPERPPTENTAPPDTSGPSLFTAVQEQLGLKLESSKGPVGILVVDHVEKASEN